MLQYTRNQLMSLCFWWKVRPAVNIQSTTNIATKLCNPLSAETWKTLKEFDLLKPLRGKRGRRKATNLHSMLPNNLNLHTSAVSEYIGRKPAIDLNIINIQSCHTANQNNIIPTLVTDGRRHRKTSLDRRACHANLINIQTTAPKRYDFPRFLLSNTRSMANKLDEISAVITNNNCNIAVITESWLSSNISNDLISVPGFLALCKDRPDDQRGGGLCTYINAELDFMKLTDLSDPIFETQWILLKPKRLPRGINSIILGTVYHPPQNNDYALRNHLFQSLDSALARFPNSGIIMLGDCNKFNPGSLTGPLSII